jgi:hypothetical protein
MISIYGSAEIGARLTEYPGPEHVRARAVGDARPLAESQDQLDP